MRPPLGLPDTRKRMFEVASMLADDKAEKYFTVGDVTLLGVVEELGCYCVRVGGRWVTTKSALATVQKL